MPSSLPDPRGGATCELSLDPEDWDRFRNVAHAMLDEMIEYQRTAGARPAWRPVPGEVRARLDEPLPLEGQPLEDVCAQFVRDVLPYPTGNIHPRFWGWVLGNGTPVGMLAEMLAAGMNANVMGFDQSAVHVERRVVRWFTELMGFPESASGILVSGGTMANLVGLAAARSAGAGFDVCGDGLQGGGARLLVYGSVETHTWVLRACEVLGLGRSAYRPVPVGPDYRILTERLAAMVHSDREAGHRPICVVGNAGTVNTGATDDLQALAAFCRAEALWFHVDGAFGALAALSPHLRAQVAGLEEADSLAFDLHKWGGVPYEAGCALLRDREAHRAPFAAPAGATYLTSPGRGVQPGRMEFGELGVQLSRGFRALKVWMSLKAQGVRAWSRSIEQNVEQAEYLASLVDAHPHLELLAPVPLNVVCFRYAPPGVEGPALDELNREVLLRIQESGLAVPSSTILQGRFALRVAITNHRSRRDDFALLAGAVVREGDALTAAADGALSP